MNKSIPVAILLFAVAFVMAGMSWAQTPGQADEDGCWATPPGCVAINSEWRGGRFISRGTNNCGGRIYVKFCNEAPGLGSEGDCGANGLRADRTTSWATGEGHAPAGSTFWRWIGSNKSGSDWVCSGKVNGWYDPPDYN